VQRHALPGQDSEVEYKGKNIHDVLQMTVKEALRFFAGQTKLLEKLAVLDEIGLGYLRLGQSATTLSGGEAQRVKLAAHLAQVRAVNATPSPRRPAGCFTFWTSRPRGCTSTTFPSC
jgi:excinuclease ABC subunit A